MTHDHELHDHDRGLAFDLSTLMQRRRLLGLIAGVGVASLAACATDSASSGASSGASYGGGTGTAAAAGSSADTTCADIPEETAGPYPGDGSNGPNILTQSGIVRSDIRSSFGSASGVATGVPLTVNLTILNTGQGCSAYPGAAVYLWHCDINGNYSMYSQGARNENYLRGVQAADGSGKVRFTSIFPAAYSGRWPHIHFEVYPDLAQATAAGTKLATSQLAFPEDVCKAVYATAGYSQSVRNLAQTSLARDMVFSDGYSRQMATLTGDVSAGYVASLTVAV